MISIFIFFFAKFIINKENKMKIVATEKGPTSFHSVDDVEAVNCYCDA